MILPQRLSVVFAFFSFVALYFAPCLEFSLYRSCYFYLFVEFARSFSSRTYTKGGTTCEPFGSCKMFKIAIFKFFSQKPSEMLRNLSNNFPIQFRRCFNVFFEKLKHAKLLCSSTPGGHQVDGVPPDWSRPPVAGRRRPDTPTMCGFWMPASGARKLAMIGLGNLSMLFSFSK